MIRFENITKSYGDNRVIADLNFEIAKGEFFVLIGPSGSGKTTTLKMINRLITPSQGDIYLNDKNITDISLRELRLDMGYVLQQIALFPNLTVRENIELIPEMKAWSKGQKQIDSKKRRNYLIKLACQQISIWNVIHVTYQVVSNNG